MIQVTFCSKQLFEKKMPKKKSEEASEDVMSEFK